MSASILQEAYVYMATTTDTVFPLDEGKYPITRLRLSDSAKRHIHKFGICVKIGSTTKHPSTRSYQLESEKGMIIIKTQTLQTTPAGLLLIESILRQQLESHPYAHQIGTDTFQVFTDSHREDVIAHWEEWLDKALRLADIIGRKGA